MLVDGEAIKVRQKKCRSMFCPSCRQERQKERQKRALKLFGHRPHDRLYSLTILYNCPTSLDKMAGLIGQFKGEVKAAFDKANHLSPVRFQGAMEMDLKHAALFAITNDAGGYETREHSKQAMAALGIDIESQSCPPEWWLLHFHALVDIGSNSLAVVKQVLKASFKGSHRVQLKALHSPNKTPKVKSIENLAAYQLKSKLQYAENIYADNPSVPNKSRYGKAYDPLTMANLCKLYDRQGNIDFVKYDFGTRRFNE